MFIEQVFEKHFQTILLNLVHPSNIFISIEDGHVKKTNQMMIIDHLNNKIFTKIIKKNPSGAINNKCSYCTLFYKTC